MQSISITTHTGKRSYQEPLVMAIINITPDSFSDAEHLYQMNEVEQDSNRLLEVVRNHLKAGAEILDIGGYSTRPGAAEVTEEEEWRRVRWAASTIRNVYPDVVLSVDTFRASIAEKSVRECQVDIINDISGGQLDSKMFETVGRLHVPYILTHTRGTPQTMQSLTEYEDLLDEVEGYFDEKIEQLRGLGVEEIIIDPGFGFAKTVEQNYSMLRQLEKFQQWGLPILVGVSRKSMIYKPLGIQATEAQNGTTALNMVAVLKGASILRVHNSKEAKEVITLGEMLMRENA